MAPNWEVDPETKTKLLQISKTNGNDKCCDCGAPSPQWASPKFGTFICLNCAGTHRGLGVHISFVRSITMDAFKHAEIQRMESGGNEPWKSFYDAHPVTISEGRTFEDSTIKERYEGDAGDEWKERLSCKIEGREYVPGQEKKNNNNNNPSRSNTPLSLGSNGVGAVKGVARTASPATTKKEQNEQYFAKMGNENAARSDALPPSQGGKFTGFGGGMPQSPTGERRASPFGGLGGIGGLDDFQKDPMGSLTKGLGWFASTVGKSAKTVNESYLQPTAKQVRDYITSLFLGNFTYNVEQIAESDFAAQARVRAANLGQNLQAGARGAADQFNRFVEGQEGDSRSGIKYSRVEPERREFWDDFSDLGVQDKSDHQRAGSRSDVVGTAAMRKNPAPSLSGSSTAAGESGVEHDASKSKSKAKEEWDDNW
ncbi:Arf GTPase activating protein [Penicillium taxi]|uniref:Arf GTPase activating protein n=1 Tax=Penicillium taxi TaxID=168475 RepID=UPI0025458ECD|nr:Arf GTPase activating protein [Penicillium taxi]KAJ5908386.1 Arf GTPase activating protein [Penicillium taxi]